MVSLIERLKELGIIIDPNVATTHEEIVKLLLSASSVTGTAGAAGGAGTFGAGLGRAVGKAPTPKVAETAVKKVSEKTIQRIAAQFGRSEETVRNSVSVVKMEEAIRKASRSGWQKLLVRGGVTAGGVFAFKTLVADPAAMATWAAFDNVIQNGGFLSQKLLSNVIFDNLDIDEALEAIEQIETNFAIAETTVNTASLLDPRLWGYRKTYKAGIDQNRESIERNKGLILKRKEEIEGTEDLSSLRASLTKNEFIDLALESGKTYEEIEASEGARQRLGLFTKEEEEIGLAEAEAAGDRTRGEEDAANVKKQEERESHTRNVVRLKGQESREFKSKRPSARDPALRVKPRKKESPVSKLK